MKYNFEWVLHADKALGSVHGLILWKFNRLGVTVPYMEPLYFQASCKCRDFSKKSARKELDS